MELFFVILIILIILFFAIPRFRLTFTSLELANFSKKVSSLMRYAQSRAIAEGIKIYFLKNDDNFILTKDSSEISNKKREILDGKFSLAIPGKINVRLEMKEIIFHPDGRIELKEPNSNNKPGIILSNEVNKFKIVATGEIGKIIIEENYEE